MYRAVQQLRPRLLLAACPQPAASFEAAAMFLCATSYGRGNRPAHRPRTAGTGAASNDRGGPATVADFDSSAAAARFRAAVADQVDHSVWVDRLRYGIRHQYEVHRVQAPGQHVADVLSMLGSAWRRGVLIVTDTRPTSPSSARWRHRRDLATAVWRAALLAGPTVRTTRGLRIRMPTDLAPVMVRAARLLGVGAEVRHHPSAPIVCIPNDREAMSLLSCLTWRGEPRVASALGRIGAPGRIGAAGGIAVGAAAGIAS